MEKDNRMVVFTGGPGNGKTILLKELKSVGLRCVDEIARQVIKEQVKIKRDALPWKNKELYKEIVLDKSIESYQMHKPSKNEFIIFD